MNDSWFRRKTIAAAPRWAGRSIGSSEDLFGRCRVQTNVFTNVAGVFFMQGHTKRRIALGVTTGGLLAGGGLGFAHAATTNSSGSSGGAAVSDSPGILSGNLIQIPVDIPINVCGVTANVLGLLNPAAGNDCSNSGGATASGGAAASGGSAGGASAQGGAHGSPGVLSGNSVQVPVNVPVNVCGDSVNVIGSHNSAVGNHCSNSGGGTTSGGGATATGGTHGSPGIGSGNNIQLPIDIPVNACGDTVSVIGAKDSAKHNACDNGGGSTTTTTPPTTPPTPVSPPPPVHSTTPPTNPPTTPGTPSSTMPGGGNGTTGGSTGGSNGGTVGGETQGDTLAHTGADGLMLAPVGAGMAGAGLVLYRKFKPAGSH
jgi:hypothetical protein